MVMLLAPVVVLAVQRSLVVCCVVLFAQAELVDVIERFAFCETWVDTHVRCT